MTGILPLVSANSHSNRNGSDSYDAAAANRLTSLDSLRGLAALSVVACHYIIALQDTGFGRFAWQWLWIPPFTLLTTAFGSVVLFFVLSGYVLALSLLRDGGTGWGRFALRRLLRIWPPYAAVILASFAICHVALPSDAALPPPLSGAWHGSDITLANLCDELLMVTSRINLDVVGWSLVHEMRISLIFPLLLLFLRRAPKTTMALAIGLHVASSDGPTWLSALLPDTAAYIVYFVAGAWLALNRGRLIELKWGAPLARISLFAIALLLLSVPGNEAWSGIFAGVGATLMIAVVTVSPGIVRALSAQWCAFLGRVSYSLYLTHVVVLLTLVRLLGNLLPVWIILLIAVPIIPIVAAAGYRYLEQPSIEIGRAVSRRFLQHRLRTA
ncbi:MAG: acyltransferase family protein [Rhizomicrobium sp.]